MNSLIARASEAATTIEAVFTVNISPTSRNASSVRRCIGIVKLCWAAQ